MSSYSSDWKKIVFRIKSKVEWYCQKFRQQYFCRGRENISLNRAEKAVLIGSGRRNWYLPKGR